MFTRTFAVVLAASVFCSAAFAVETSRTLTEVATIDDGGGNSRLLMDWSADLGAANFAIRKAVLRFDLGGAAEARTLRLNLHPVTAPWDAASVDWSSGWSTPGGDFDAEVQARAELDLSRGGAPVAWDLTSVVKEVLENRRTSYGFLITADPADGVGLRPDDAARFAGLGNATIEVTYRKTPPVPREIAAQDSAIVR